MRERAESTSSSLRINELWWSADPSLRRTYRLIDRWIIGGVSTGSTFSDIFPLLYTFALEFAGDKPPRMGR